MYHTVLPANNTIPASTSYALARWCHHWLWWTSNCSLLFIYQPWKDERLIWPGWLTYSGWFTLINGHLLAVGWVQDKESSPVKDQSSTISCVCAADAGGHYTTYALNYVNLSWYEYDDQIVTEVDPQQVENCEAYVLFYRWSRTFREFLSIVGIINCHNSFDKKHLTADDDVSSRWLCS